MNGHPPMGKRHAEGMLTVARVFDPTSSRLTESLKARQLHDLPRHDQALSRVVYVRDRGRKSDQRHAENTGDAVLAQHPARHKDLRTTLAYFHGCQPRLLKAAVRLDRKAKLD